MAEGDDRGDVRSPGRSGVRVTSLDVARIAKVSPSAVSLAFNGRPGVSEQTRQRVLRVAAELNWRPNRAARALRDASSDAVGLVVARPASTLGVEPFFAQLLSGLQARLSGDGIALQLLVVEDTDAECRVYQRWAAEKRVDGVVLLDLQVDDPRPALTARLGLPTVVLGGDGDVPRASTVRVDDFAAMTRLVSHLADLGHRRIAHVSGTTRFLHTRSRLEALHELALRRDLTVIASPTDFTDHEATDATRFLLTGSTPPTAITYDNDVMAVAGLKVAGELGLSVPGQLSLASFDDSILTRLTHPALTSLSRDTGSLGELVAGELIALIAEPAAARVVQARTPHLVVRGSAAEPCAPTLERT